MMKREKMKKKINKWGEKVEEGISKKKCLKRIIKNRERKRQEQVETEQRRNKRRERKRKIRRKKMGEN